MVQAQIHDVPQGLAGYGARDFVARGHEPSLMPHYATHEIKDIGGLSALVGR